MTMWAHPVRRQFSTAAGSALEGEGTVTSELHVPDCYIADTALTTNLG